MPTMPRKVHTLLSLSLVASATLLAPASASAETTGERASVAYFVSPDDDTVYPEAPAVVDFDIGVFSTGWDGGISEVTLYVDNVLIETLSCDGGCLFEGVELAQGERTVSAFPDNGEGDVITLWVAEEPPAETDTGESGEESGEESGGESGEESSGESGEESGGESGEDTGESAGDDVASDTGGQAEDAGMTSRGCSVEGSPSPWGLLGLPLLLLIPGLRRRDGGAAR